MLTNQLAWVVDEAFDTNLFDFTTNWFQAYDVELTNGANQITLTVSDRAGNQTVTNIGVTLDYTTATNPPTMEILWPPSGTELSGDTFHLRGRINDETASVAVELVNTNGVTNVISGLVERNGMFWVEGLPLAEGTNTFTLRARDAADNLSTTNLNVVKSSMTLTIDSTPAGQDLYEPSGTVSGTVSDPGASVTVNGVVAAVDPSSGNRTAENVPIYGRGTATFSATATASGGGGSTTGASVAVEMPAAIKVVEYHSTRRAKTWDHDTGEVESEHNWDKDYSARYERNQEGEWHLVYSGNARLYDHYIFGSTYREDYEWSSDEPDKYYTIIDGQTFGPFVEAPEGTFGEKVLAVPDETVIRLSGIVRWMKHYHAKRVRHRWTNVYGNDGRSTATARTRLVLYTGGKAQVRRNSLFRIQASAEEYKKPPLYSGVPYYPWIGTQTPSIPPDRIQVLGEPLSDGSEVWMVQPDNAQIPVDLLVRGTRHLNAGASASGYRLQILRAGLVVTGKTNNVIVGENIQLTAELRSPYGQPAPPITSYQWTVPGYAISDYTADVNTGKVHTAFATTTNTVSYYWVDGGNKTVVCTVQAMGMLLMTGVHFDVFRPSAELSIIVSGTIGADTDYGPATPTTPYLHLGDNAGVVGVKFLFTNAILGSYTNAWQFSFVQVGLPELKQCVEPTGTHCKGYTNGLNTYYPYALFPNQLSGSDSDSPGMELHGDAATASLVEDFALYLMFKPGYPVVDSVTVPINVAEWGWGGEAVQTNGVWTLSEPTPPTSTSGAATTTYPEWEHNIDNSVWTTNAAACSCP